MSAAFGSLSNSVYVTVWDRGVPKRLNDRDASMSFRWARFGQTSVRTLNLIDDSA